MNTPELRKLFDQYLVIFVGSVAPKHHYPVIDDKPVRYREILEMLKLVFKKLSKPINWISMASQ